MLGRTQRAMAAIAVFVVFLMWATASSAAVADHERGERAGDDHSEPEDRTELPPPPPPPTPAFGTSPLDAIAAAADAALATPGSCQIPSAQLQAAMLAPVWAETVGNTVTSAPSPMTLSRSDVQPALYSFVKTNVAEGSFWHPGVGLWQLDSAGLGAGLTAAERIDVTTAAPLVASLMLDRLCSTGFESVWSDWVACGAQDAACIAVYDLVYDREAQVLVPITGYDISALGGMEWRSCRVDYSVTVDCGYIDPAKAEGNASWAVPSFGPSPVTEPFYVFSHEGSEVRHWMPADAGHARSVRATRPIGTNARTTLAWTTIGALCDLTAGEGDCITRCMDKKATVRIALGEKPTSGDDIILGSVGNDRINAKAGDDIVCGGEGNDRLIGAVGDDVLVGGPGDDRLVAGPGADKLGGGGGDDVLLGGAGKDALSGGAGADVIDGGGQADRLEGGADDDQLIGQGGNDVLLGGGGNDEIEGGAGDDTAKGGNGSDNLSGNSGADKLLGGSGADVVAGGKGTDTCNGGSGQNTLTSC